MKSFFTTFFLATMATTSFAHMEMSDPPPFRSKYNKLATNIDYSMTDPLDKSGSDYACKGFLSDLGTAAGGSVASWAAGSSQKFTIVGGASHNGGSCQASISTDSGKTFKVIHSYIGNCPLVSDFPFTVPGDTPTGEAVFAWTWFNKVGNREMYMNCASVTITAGSGTTAVAFSARPDIFVANAGTDCTTVESSDLKFPNPGPDVTTDTQGTADPVGSACGSSSSTVSDSSSADTGAATSAAATSVVATEVPTTFTTAAIPTSSNTGQSASINTGTSSSLTPTTNGECGGSQTCAGSGFGQCCSKYGYCGVTSAHCGVGCDPTFGICGKSVASGTAAASAGVSVASGAAKVAANSFLVASDAAGSNGEAVTKTETEVVYSTIYITDRAAATVAAQAAVNVGGRSTFQTVTRRM